jgi:hypothetical protein
MNAPGREHEFSWEKAKSPRSTEILDVIPSQSTFRALEDRANVLARELHSEAGVMKTDAPADQLAELAEAYEHLGRLDDLDYVLAIAARKDA